LCCSCTAPVTFTAPGRSSNTTAPFRQWYINFEAAVVRGSGHIDTEDYGLDLISKGDGRREWKEVPDLHHQQVEGRTSAQTALTVLAAAAEVEADLNAGDLWWARWNDWTPF